jgi:hypothetical protein
MADEKRDAPSPVSGGKRRRPPSTIDVKATEIASEPVKPTQPVDPAPETPPVEAASVATTAAPEPAAEPVSAPKPEPSPDVSAQPRPDVSPGSPDAAAVEERKASAWWLPLGAGVAAALCVVLALWSLGLFAPRDDLPAKLAARQAALETQVRELAGKPQPVFDQRPLADLESRLARTEQSVARIAELDARIAKAESAAAAAPRATPPDQALTDRVAALEAALRPLADLGSRTEAAAEAARAAKAQANAASDIAERVAARPVPTLDHGEIDVLAARIAALEQLAKSAEERIARAAAAGNADRAARLALVATALRSAVERGEPFAPELAAAKPLVSDPAPLAPLEPYAASGVPRSAALARELSALTAQMLDVAGAAAPREGGFIDRLQANAGRLVRVRPVNEAPGDDPAALVVRAEGKAAQGDIAAAIAELARLPEPLRAPALGWIKKAQSQAAALAAARQLADGAIGALGKPTP